MNDTAKKILERALAVAELEATHAQWSLDAAKDTVQRTTDQVNRTQATVRDLQEALANL
jgi:hypothetical protein